MKRHTKRVMLGGLGGGVVASALARPGPAGAGGEPGDPMPPVVAWIDRHAVPLATTDPGAPLDDLNPLRHVAGSAEVVGLGEATHGSRELFRIKHRLVRFLVEHMGVRTVAFEEDFAGGVLLDRYVVTGEGDPRQLLADAASPFWASEEILDLLRWMRAFNHTREDKVRFLGTDAIVLRELSFEEVSGYVRRVAPERLEELERDLDQVRPMRSRFEHLQWYFQRSEAEKQQLIESARRVSRLVHGLPATAPRLEREYARQHARTILGWYETYAVEQRLVRERFIADTITWWQDIVGARIVYWAASAHTTAASMMRLTVAGEEGPPAPYAGGYLRERLGRRYVSIGTVFHSGAINSGYAPPAPHPIGPPAPGLVDATLGEARRPDYLLDLHAPAAGPVQAWRNGPATMRMIHPMYAAGQDPSGYTMAVDSLLGAFDVLVHLRTTTPSRLFPWTPR
jgi:erythromycin esterase